MPAQANIGKRRTSARTVAVAIICVALLVAIVFAAATALGLRWPAAQSSSAQSAQVSSSNAAASESSGATEESEPSSAAAQEESQDSFQESSSASSKEPEDEGYNQFKAEAQAREDAMGAGMQVFVGTVHMTTFGQRAAEKLNERQAKAFDDVAYEQLAVLEFGVDEEVTALSARTMNIETRGGQDSISLGYAWSWEEFDGQLVTVAAYADDMLFPGDLAAKLYSVTGNVELIAPLTEERAATLAHARQGQPDPLPAFIEPEEEEEPKKSASKESQKSSASAPASSGDYMLADSATHAYSAGELQSLSDYELFIARNEIYARHGRKFQSAELQSYFDSKSWYRGTADPSSFDESVLSDTEQANAAVIRQVEESRNSKYL